MMVFALLVLDIIATIYSIMCPSNGDYFEYVSNLWFLYSDKYYICFFWIIWISHHHKAHSSQFAYNVTCRCRAVMITMLWYMVCMKCSLAQQHRRSALNRKWAWTAAALISELHCIAAKNNHHHDMLIRICCHI